MPSPLHDSVAAIRPIAGGGLSERQWLDVLNVMKVQAGRLDDAYLEEWADALDVTKLLRKARAEAAG